MAAVGPGHTVVPRVWNSGVEFPFQTQWHLDHAVLPAASAEALVAMLNQQDTLAPRFMVRHVPLKQEYVYMM